jgi:hypothetical protein
MVNYFSSSPSTLSGGSCMCGTAVQTIEPFVENPSYLESESFMNTFYDPSQVSTTSDPISGLFSKFFESPVQQEIVPQLANQQSPLNPIIDTVSHQLGLAPSTMQSMIHQTASSFGINPSELKENVAHFFSQFGISRDSIQSVLKEIASQVGLNNKMGYSGTINPKVIKNVLQKSNIKVKENNYLNISQHNPVNKQIQLQSLNKPNQLPSNTVSHNAIISNMIQNKVDQGNKAANNKISQNTLVKNAAVLVQPNAVLVKPNAVEVPVVTNSQGNMEPVVLKSNGVITTASNKPLVVNNAGVLTNKQNGVAVTVNNAKVVKNSAGQLVNSQTGNPVSVLSTNSVNQTIKQNSFQNAAPNAVAVAAADPNQPANVQPTYTNANWIKRFPKMTTNNVQRLRNYTSRHEGVDFSQVDPAALQNSIDKFLQEYATN